MFLHFLSIISSSYILKKIPKIKITNHPEPSFGTEKSVQCFVRYTFCKVERYLGSPLKSSSFFKRALFFHKMLVWIFCSKMFTICMFMHVTSHNAHSPAAFCFTSGPQVRRCSYPLSKAGVVRWNDHELVHIYIPVHGIMLGGVRWMAGVTSSAYGHVLGKAGVTCM